MTNLIDVVSGVSTTVKVGWVVWLAWAVVQVRWYRAAREQDRQIPVENQPEGWQTAAGFDLE